MMFRMFITKTAKIPLIQDDQGVIRIRGTRVLLEAVVIAYKQDDTSVKIAQKYLLLNPKDIYAVIAYFSSYQEPMEQYLA